MTDAEKIAALLNALDQIVFTCDGIERGDGLDYDDIRDIANDTRERIS